MSALARRPSVYIQKGAHLAGVSFVGVQVICATELPMSASVQEMLADTCEKVEGVSFTDCIFATHRAVAEVEARYAVAKAMGAQFSNPYQPR